MKWVTPWCVFAVCRGWTNQNRIRPGWEGFMAEMFLVTKLTNGFDKQEKKENNLSLDTYTTHGY